MVLLHAHVMLKLGAYRWRWSYVGTLLPRGEGTREGEGEEKENLMWFVRREVQIKSVRDGCLGKAACCWDLIIPRYGGQILIFSTGVSQS